MANQTVSFRLPRHIVKAIEDRAKLEDRSKTFVLIRALEQYLGLNQTEVERTILERLKNLEAKVKALEDEAKLVNCR